MTMKVLLINFLIAHCFTQIPLSFQSHDHLQDDEPTAALSNGKILIISSLFFVIFYVASVYFLYYSFMVE